MREKFQSTRPARGATVFISPSAWGIENFNPRAPQGARRYDFNSLLWEGSISIHAPRKGRDSLITIIIGGSRNFNPRAPQGARHRIIIKHFCFHIFQSTRPARGATTYQWAYNSQMVISIHAPRKGRDASFERICNFIDLFQSTRPARGATLPLSCNASASATISIHAPRKGRDFIVSISLPTPSYFNPRAPQGARLSKIRFDFESNSISIHAPRKGRDLLASNMKRSSGYFNPRAPQGARPPSFLALDLIPTIFQSTRPARGAT